MAQAKIMVSVDEGYLKRFAAFVKSVKQAGMTVEGEHKEIGVVTGSIDAAKVSALSRVRGVAHVEAEGQMQIAPPESDIQ